MRLRGKGSVEIWVDSHAEVTVAGATGIGASKEESRRASSVCQGSTSINLGNRWEKYDEK